ncbi:MAG TPA: sigma-70 family RNA polymerase sigma factor [Vicinamibacteria bacterium]|nr:sigma-70 family RNA polymerase sigma factor [Vicinamibacteria bacterium]
MRRLAAGDRDALAPLMERHYRRLYRLALSYLRNPDDALDAVQETFVKAFQNAARWDGSAEAGAWLSRIAINVSIDRYRRDRRRQATFAPLGETDHDESLAGAEPSPERRALGSELAGRVASAVKGLPEKQRAVFVLRHYEEMSLVEIAESLGMSLGTVKSSLHRAVHRLRERLQGMRA